MDHPEAPAAPPLKKPSPDTTGPVDLSCLARSWAERPGAACKAFRRTGKAGSAAAACCRRFVYRRWCLSAMETERCARSPRRRGCLGLQPLHEVEEADLCRFQTVYDFAGARLQEGVDEQERD